MTSRDDGAKHSPFGRRIDEACADIGISPTRLGEILGMRRGYISQLQQKNPLVTGNKNFSLSPRWAFEMVAVLGVLWGWLFYNEEAKYRDARPTPRSQGQVIALLLESRGHPQGKVNAVAFDSATAKLAQEGFDSDSAWDWAEALKRERLAIESAAHAATYRKKLAATKGPPPKLQEVRNRKAVTALQAGAERGTSRSKKRNNG